MHVVAALCLVGAVALLVAYFVLVHWIIGRLRSVHPQLYSSLGSPTLVANNSPRNSMNLFWFILGGSWIGKDDQELIKACSRARIVSASYCALLILTVVFIVLGRP